MSGVNKSSRSTQRYSAALKIEENGFPAFISCRRCSKNKTSSRCTVIRDGRCSNCVRSGMEKKCDAQVPRTDRLLKAKREELDRTLAELTRTSMSAARLQKEIRHLEAKSSKELDILMKEIEAEEGGDDEGESSSVGMVVESVVTGDARPEGDPSSSKAVPEVSLESMSPDSFARWMDTVDPALLVGEFDRDYSLS